MSESERPDFEGTQSMAEAITQALQAEQQAEVAVRESRKQAEELLLAARNEAREISEKSDLRISTFHQRCAQVSSYGNISTNNSDDNGDGSAETSAAQDEILAQAVEKVAQELTSREDKLHIVQVSALCNACPVDTFAEEIEGNIPYTEARTVKQLVSSEMNILEKIEDMMFLVTVVALLASALVWPQILGVQTAYPVKFSLFEHKGSKNIVLPSDQAIKDKLDIGLY